MSSNGVAMIADWCSTCNKPLEEGVWIKHENLSRDPMSYDLVKDNRNAKECGYRNCIKTNKEIHHYAPKEVFGVEEAEKYVKGFLCDEHHKLYHDMVENFWFAEATSGGTKEPGYHKAVRSYWKEHFVKEDA
jgi:hypothetical protein